MRLYTLINTFISRCFQFKTKQHEHKHTQTEPCLSDVNNTDNCCCRRVRRAATLTTQTKDMNTKTDKKRSRASEKSTKTVEEPLLEKIYEQPTAPEALHAPTGLLPIRIEKRKHNETIPNFFYRIWQKHRVHMRAARKGIDGHGHMFYCFSCRQPNKDHKSFDSKEALESHCEAKHNMKITI